MEVNHSLVDPHLELVPGLGSLSARSLPGGDPEHLGRHPHRALHLQLLVLGAADEVAADLLQRLDVPGGEGDPDPVHGHVLLHTFSILTNMYNENSCSVQVRLNFSILCRKCWKATIKTPAIDESEVLANPSHL